MTLRAEVLEVAALTAEDEARYAALAAAMPFASPFLALDFIKACASVLPGVRVARIRDGAGVPCYLPFQRHRSPYGLSRMAMKLGAHLSDCCSVVGRFEADYRLLPGLLGVDAVWFDHVPIDNIGGACGRREVTIGKRIEIGTNLEAYWRAMEAHNPDLLRKMRRWTRKIERELGPVRYVAHACDHAALDTLIRHKREQFRRTGLGDAFCEEWAVRLLHALLDLPEDGALRPRLSMLYGGDTWLSSHFGLSSGKVLHYWFPVFDRGMSSYGPGHLLNRFMLEDMAREGQTTFDLGEGDNAHKTAYVTTDYTLAKIFLTAASPGGLLSRAEHGLRWRLAARKAGRVGATPAATPE